MMTDRIQHVMVTLDADYRDDDVQTILDAIRMIKGVTHCEMGEPVDVMDKLARRRASQSIRQKIVKILDDEAFREA
jgi:hypothetical protein